MPKQMKDVVSIDEYIQLYPKEIQDTLQKLRQTIKKAAPKSEEVIRYGIPTFRLKGNLVHFGAFKNHIGFYPAPSGIEAFKKELKPYLAGKGSLKFPLDQPIPFELVAKIVQFRVEENLAQKT